MKRFKRKRKRVYLLHKNYRNIPINKSSDFFNTGYWKKLREIVFGLYGKRCMKCGYSGYRIPIQVDHIMCRSRYQYSMWAVSNLQVLCMDCNQEKWTALIDYRSDSQKFQLKEYLNKHPDHF